MIVVGSAPVSYILNRRPKDIDLFSTRAEFLDLLYHYDGECNDRGGHLQEGKMKYEFQFSDEWPSCKIIEDYCTDYTNTIFGRIKCISPQVACVIKKSHLYRQINFYKHMMDFQCLLKYLKLTWSELIDSNGLKSIYQARLEDTKNHFPDRTPSLAKTKDDFFNDYVEKIFIHDEMHAIVAHKDRPMYEYCQHEEVLCDKSLWLQLSHEDKIAMAREEALVIALERKIIPRWKNSEEYRRWYKDGYYYAVMRICTNLCRGWFREFAQLNYIEIIDYNFEKKFDYFFTKVAEGKITQIS